MKPQDIELYRDVWDRQIVPRLEETGGGCLEFAGTRAHGYGMVRVRGIGMRRVSRISGVLYLGLDIDDRATFVCHECDNPPCGNPDHLFLGTAADNKRDSIDKNRAVFGRQEIEVCRKGLHLMSETRKVYGDGRTRCGECQRARHAAYMRGWNQRKAAAK